MKLILLLVLLFLILGCKSEGDIFKPETNFGYGYFKCKINGEEFVAATDKKFVAGTGSAFGIISPSGGSSYRPPSAYLDKRIGRPIKIVGYRDLIDEDKMKRKEIAIRINGELKTGHYSTTHNEVSFTAEIRYPINIGYNVRVLSTDSLYSGWLEIKKYDEEQEIIAGRFGFDAISNDPWVDTVIKIISVTDGVFSISTKENKIL